MSLQYPVSESQKKLNAMINNHIIKNSKGQIYSEINSLMICELENIIDYLELGSLPNMACYIFVLPNELLYVNIDYHASFYTITSPSCV